jgi:hypothetical protein
MSRKSNRLAVGVIDRAEEGETSSSHAMLGEVVVLITDSDLLGSESRGGVPRLGRPRSRDGTGAWAGSDISD